MTNEEKDILKWANEHNFLNFDFEVCKKVRKINGWRYYSLGWREAVESAKNLDEPPKYYGLPIFVLVKNDRIRFCTSKESYNYVFPDSSQDAR